PRAGALLVLLLRDPEHEHGADAERRELGRLTDDLVNRALRDPVQPFDGAHDTLAGAGENGHDDVVEREPMLAHERAQRLVAPQPAQAGDRKRRHLGKGTSSGSSRLSCTGISAPASQVSNSTRSWKNS